MIKRRITTAVLTVALLLQTGNVFAGPWDYVMEEYLYDHGLEEANGEIYYEAGTNSIGRAVKFSMDMGLIANYVPGTTVTRQELKNALKLIFKDDYMFNKYYKAGSEDEILTADETIIVFMDAAGYGPYFEMQKLEGITAYYLEASRQGLLDNVAYSEAKKKLTAEQFYNMFYNLLHIKTIERTFKSDNSTYVFSDKTLMETDLKLKKLTGVVRANSYTSVNGGPIAGDNMLRIGNNDYKCKNIKDTDLFLGYMVEAYADKDGNICSIAVDERYNTMKIFNDSVYVKPSGNRNVFQYYDDKGNVKTLNLNKYADVVYNHIAFPGYTEEVFNIKNGYMQFIDHDDDGLYDIVFIYEYTSFMPAARYTEDYTVVDKLGNKYDVSEIVQRNKYRGIFNSKNEEAKFEDINMRTGISLLTAHGSNVVTELFIIEENTFEGKYSQYNKKNKKPYKIEDQSFNMAEIYLEESGGKFPHSLGDRIMVYLDPRGKIINSVTVDNRLKYGYARKFGIEDKIDKGAKLQLFTEDGQMMIYDFASKIEYNGTTIKEKDIFSGAMPELYNRNSLKKQLVRYMLNSDGEIRKLETATENTATGSYNEGDGFEINYDCDTQGELYYNGGSIKAFGTKYRINTAKTIMFNVPKDDNERYYRISATESISNNEKYGVKIYDVDDCYTPAAIVMRRAGETGYDWLSSEWETSCFIIQSGQSYDEVNEETLDYLTYRASWWEQTAYKNPEYCRAFKQNGWQNGGRYSSVNSWEDIQNGDMIEFTTDYTGRTVLFGISLALDYTRPLAEQAFERAKVQYNSDKAWGIDENKFYADDLVAFGKVVKKHSEGMVFNAHSENNFGDKKWNRTILCGETYYVNCYNIGKDESSLLRFSDIQEGDFVFIEMEKGSLSAMSVYRR